MEVVKLWKETRKKLLSSFTNLKFGQINNYLVANMCAYDHHGIHLKFERTNILKKKIYKWRVFNCPNDFKAFAGS